MLHGIRWVLFDAVGTLIYAAPPVAEVYYAAARQFGSTLSSTEIETRFCDALQADQRPRSVSLERLPTSEAEERERWRRIVATVINDVPFVEELFAKLWNHFAQAESWRLFGDVPLALESLVKQGVRLGIASNFDARLHRVVAGMPALSPIERVFVSSQIGYVKPDPRFFVGVQATLGVKPEEILLIGDDEVNDSGGADAAGWRNVLIDREEFSAKHSKMSSLKELSNVISRPPTQPAR
jgi:putative hydrolase of the HAD superfamily